MPIYEYRREDGTTFDVMQSFSEPTLTLDPETGQKVTRVMHAPAVHFKGSGFYNTDYGTKKRQRENSAAAEGGADKQDAKTTDKSESSPAPASKHEKTSAASSSSSSSD